MASSDKKRISASLILSDIRSGLDDARLMSKHGLSEKALNSVLAKLTADGHLSEAEIKARGSSGQGPHPDDARSRCPSCGSSLPSQAAECPTCGVVIAKFTARQERQGPIPPDETEGDTGKGLGRIVVMCLVMTAFLVGALLLLWPRGKDDQGSPADATATGSTSPPATVTQAAGDKGSLIYLQFSGDGFPLGLSVSEGSGIHLFDTPSPDQGFKKLPPETEAKRHYDQFTVAGRTFLVLTEESKPPKFYLDANGNGDLTDDPGPFVGEGPNLVPNHYKLLLPYRGEKRGVPYRVWMFPSRMGGVRFYPKCHRHTLIEINDQDYPVVLFDGNADGDYSN
ncbi:MAG: zinc ribbon domain-containing protein, partial [Pseudomonadota bacterium]